MKSPQRLLAALWAALVLPVAAAPLAYVPNEKSATVSVIDTADDHVQGSFPVGQRPRGIAVGRQHLYLTDGKTGSLLIVDLQRGQRVRQVAVGDSPEGVSLSPDGRRLAVAVEDDNSVVLLSAPKARILARIKVEGRNPEHAVFSPDGRWLYVDGTHS